MKTQRLILTTVLILTLFATSLVKAEALYHLIGLGTLGGSESDAYSINNNGQIVGVAYDSSGWRRATLFDPTGGGNNIDLNTLIDPALGWTLREARSINDKGWIVGYGYNPIGQDEAFLLIPEPATLLLFSFGGLVLRRKNH